MPCMGVEDQLSELKEEKQMIRKIVVSILLLLFLAGCSGGNVNNDVDIDAFVPAYEAEPDEVLELRKLTKAKLDSVVVEIICQYSRDNDINTITNSQSKDCIVDSIDTAGGLGFREFNDKDGVTVGYCFPEGCRFVAKDFKRYYF